MIFRFARNLLIKPINHKFYPQKIRNLSSIIGIVEIEFRKKEANAFEMNVLRFNWLKSISDTCSKTSVIFVDDGLLKFIVTIFSRTKMVFSRRFLRSFILLLVTSVKGWPSCAMCEMIRNLVECCYSSPKSKWRADARCWKGNFFFYIILGLAPFPLQKR